MRLQLLALVTAALALGACTVPPQRAPGVTTAMAPPGQLEELSIRLPGRYGAPRRLDQERAGARITVSLGPGDDARQVLELRQEGQTRQRGMILVLPANSPSPFLQGEFIPLLADGTLSSRGCPMRFRIQGRLLFGETDPQQCRFGAGRDDIGLLKEVALDGRQIVIADQLRTFDSDEPDNPPDILTLYRLARFEGQVRVREKAGGGWRSADRIEATVGGTPVEPLDVADMSLGIQIRLELIAGRPDAPPLLYLRVIDSSKNVVLGQAWSDLHADRLGLALENIQIALERQGAGPGGPTLTE